MSLSEDKQWAAKYILDPLTAPEPSDETGPGTHFVSSVTWIGSPPAPFSPGKRVAPMTPRRHDSVKRLGDRLAPVTLANPQSHEGHRLSSYCNCSSSPTAFEQHRHHKTRSMDYESLDSRIRSKKLDLHRGHSLKAHYQGDQPAQPLEVLKREARRDHRPPHLQKKHLPGPDTIDWLDESGTLYHHEGPYDAALLARNICLASSLVEAVKASNEEALKAAPRERITDALERHRLLDEATVVRGGARDLSGRRMEYEEGSNLMIEDGDYKRWSGVEYLPRDFNGKGEPSCTSEKPPRELKSSRYRRGLSEPTSATQLVDISSTSKNTSRKLKSHGDRENSLAWRRNSTGGRLREGFRKRLGSLMKKVF